MDSWGLHTLIDMKGCEPDLIRDQENIRRFVETLIVEIDMVPLDVLSIKYCETHDPNKYGWSFYQMIQDSNISGHLVDIDNSGYIDVFSCKNYDPEVVLSLIQVFFEPQHVITKSIPRG